MRCQNPVYVEQGVFMIKFALFALLLLTISCNKKEKIELTNDLEKSSYAVGLQIGKNFKNQGLSISKEHLNLGIKDGLDGVEQLKPEELQKALLALQKELTKKNKEKEDSRSLENLAYLEKVKKTGSYKQSKNGVLYLVQKEGSGKIPKIDSTIKVNYRGKLIDGTEFDSTYKRNAPMTFKMNQTILGWQEVLLSQKVGARVQMIIPANLAYGQMSRPGIPANSILVYDLELLE